MDFVFDRTAEGRVIKSLTVVDDATHEAVAIVPERAIGGMQLTRVLDQLAKTRGLPKAIRTDNGKEYCSRAMLTWAHGCSPLREPPCGLLAGKRQWPKWFSCFSPSWKTPFVIH